MAYAAEYLSQHMRTAFRILIAASAYLATVCSIFLYLNVKYLSAQLHSSGTMPSA
jgi:sulfur relay (sulfurtransferase) complex TusBCD TusD component (DsrE family)